MGGTMGSGREKAMVSVPEARVKLSIVVAWAAETVARTKAAPQERRFTRMKVSWKKDGGTD